MSKYLIPLKLFAQAWSVWISYLGIVISVTMFKSNLRCNIFIGLAYTCLCAKLAFYLEKFLYKKVKCTIIRLGNTETGGVNTFWALIKQTIKTGLTPSCTPTLKNYSNLFFDQHWHLKKRPFQIYQTFLTCVLFETC